MRTTVGNETVPAKDPSSDPTHPEHEHDLSPAPVTRFTDSEGVLLYVKLVVKSPCKMLGLVFSTCVLITILLAITVFAAGNPITDGDSEFDIYDKRSVAYSSLDFASVETSFDRAKVLADASALPPLRQSEGSEFTYWIYEARSSRGVFTPKGLELLAEAEGVFTGYPTWTDWCLLEYDRDDETTPPTCRRPLSALTIFAASEWDSVKVQSIMARLDAAVPGIRAEALGPAGDVTGQNIYNLFSFCVKFGVQCNPNDTYSTTMTDDEVIIGLDYAQALEADLENVTSKWVGGGALTSVPDEVQLFCAYMMEVPAYRPFVDFFFDKDFSKTNPITQYSRTIIQWGSPIIDPNTNQLFEVEEDEGGVGGSDKEDNVRKDFVLDNLFDDMDKYARKGYNSDVNAYYFMGVLIFDVFIAVLQNDLYLAILSISVVFLYMRVMLKSWFLAALGMAEIVFSIPIAWFIAVSILQIKYFSGLNPMCLFIVAAIGADDIFVFMDAFKQSASKGPVINASLEARMTWTYRRAGLAMLITSATTCSAFLAVTISKIASTQSFGIFAALVIATDYALVMTLFCTAVIIYHDKFEVTSKNPCVECGLCCGCISCCSSIPTKERSTAKALMGDEQTLADDRITAFYKGPITNFVLNRTYRAITLVCFAVWLAFALFYMLQLEPTKKAEQFLDDEHPLQKAITILNNEFPKATDDTGAAIYYTWGVADVNRDGVNQLLDPGNIGKPRFVNDWTFNPVCQQKVLDLCNDFRTNAKYDAHIKDDDSGFGKLKCFVMELEDWTQGGRAGGSANGAAFPDTCERPATAFNTFPVPEADLDAAMNEFNDILSCTPEYELKAMIGTYQDAGSESANPNHIGWDGSTLKYVAISVESSVLDPFSRIAEKLARVEYDFFLALTKEIDADMEEACGPVLMTDMNQKFIFMNNQRLYRSSAIEGALVGCVIALVVIWIATRSLAIALISTFSILCVLVSVVGSVTMIGWTLGTTTSILISILAGFSVDYIVHLAHAYVTSKGTSEERIAGSFAEMGVSVMSGMMTSILASLPLFACQIVFFSSFGTFLCLTIAFSWLFANFFFMNLLAMFNVVPGDGPCIPTRFTGGANEWIAT